MGPGRSRRQKRTFLFPFFTIWGTSEHLQTCFLWVCFFTVCSRDRQMVRPMRGVQLSCAPFACPRQRFGHSDAGFPYQTQRLLLLMRRPLIENRCTRGMDEQNDKKQRRVHSSFHLIDFYFQRIGCTAEKSGGQLQNLRSDFQSSSMTFKIRFTTFRNRRYRGPFGR